MGTGALAFDALPMWERALSPVRPLRSSGCFLRSSVISVLNTRASRSAESQAHQQPTLVIPNEVRNPYPLHSFIIPTLKTEN